MKDRSDGPSCSCWCSRVGTDNLYWRSKRSPLIRYPIVARIVGERKDGRNVLFNDALNTFYLRLYGVRYMVKDHSDTGEESRYRHMGYSFRLAARALLCASSHRQDNTYHGLCYTSRVWERFTSPSYCGVLFVTVNPMLINVSNMSLNKYIGK